MSLDNDSVLAKVLASELPVIDVDGEIVLVDDLGEVLDDLLVVPNLVVLAGVSADVAAETVQASIPLLEDDGLSLNFADGLSDDPLKRRVVSTR